MVYCNKRSTNSVRHFYTHTYTHTGACTDTSPFSPTINKKDGDLFEITLVLKTNRIHDDKGSQVLLYPVYGL